MTTTRLAALLLACAACSDDDPARPIDAGPPPDARIGPDGAALAADTSVIYLHHSTGGVIREGGVPECVADHNTAAGTAYAITEMAFPHDPYPWANYPYDYWNIWINGETTFGGQESLETLTATYGVVVFKHCFPVSGIGADTGSASVSSAEKTIENYELQYAALKTKLHEFPDTRFLVWTGAALIAGETSAADAARAQAFFAWVRDTWDEPGDNIFVWDFWTLETDGGLYLTAAHASGDSHPNATFAAEVAPYFCQRLVDVIAGRGDWTSVTGN